jgi:hypothetical protein
MSPRDPKSATVQDKKRGTAKPKGGPVKMATPDGIRDPLCRWIDLVIVPILVEQYQQEKKLVENNPDG